MRQRVYRLLISPRGQTMAEYAIILVTVAAICLALFQSGGAIVKTLVQEIGPDI
jgi:Flp pilus assembly pilin Flp